MSFVSRATATLALMVLSSSLPPPAEAAARSLTECSRNARVGNRLVMVGDDAQRTLKAFARDRSWVRKGRSRSSMVWRREGRRAATIRLTLRDGVITRICQSNH